MSLVPSSVSDIWMGFRDTCGVREGVKQSLCNGQARGEGDRWPEMKQSWGAPRAAEGFTHVWVEWMES